MSRLLWWLFRLDRYSRRFWRLLGKEDPMTAVPVKVTQAKDAADLTPAELVDGMMRARAEAVEYAELDEPERAAMRMDLVNLLLEEWASRHVVVDEGTL